MPSARFVGCSLVENVCAQSSSSNSLANFFCALSFPLRQGRETFGGPAWRADATSPSLLPFVGRASCTTDVVKNNRTTVLKRVEGTWLSGAVAPLGQVPSAEAGQQQAASTWLPPGVPLCGPFCVPFLTFCVLIATAVSNDFFTVCIFALGAFPPCLLCRPWLWPTSATCSAISGSEPSTGLGIVKHQLSSEAVVRQPSAQSRGSLHRHDSGTDPHDDFVAIIKTLLKQKFSAAG